ncbi:MAG: MGMT family protein [Armatimonadetes bacterium]|nr:MGMT family protein [Armatimonadota bacterium]
MTTNYDGKGLASELYERVAEIPEGYATSYSALGRSLSRPVSGLLVGKWMHRCPSDHPWWRVLAADGSLVVGRKDPMAGHEQRERLEAEGFAFTADGCLIFGERFWEP